MRGANEPGARRAAYVVLLLGFFITGPVAWTDSTQARDRKATPPASQIVAKSGVVHLAKVKSKDDDRHHDSDDQGNHQGPRDALAFFAPPSLSPDPFDPARQVTVLGLKFAVRAVDGLKPGSKSDDDHPGARRQFLIRTAWRIATPLGVVTIQKDTPITQPFQIVRVPKTRGRGPRKAILVPVALSWNGRTASGACLPDGDYSWTVEATFVRVDTGPRKIRKTRERPIGQQISSAGRVTTAGQPPVLTLTSPRDGLATNQTTVGFGGIVQGQEPIQVSINGTPAAVSSSLFSADRVLDRDGDHLFEILATDCALRKTTVTRRVFRDTVPATVALTPGQDAIVPTSSTTITAQLADPAPSSGLDMPGSFRATINGQDRSSAFQIAGNQASVAVQLADGVHTVASSVRDNANNEGSQTVSFRVDTVKPELTIVSPAPNATLQTTTPRFEVRFADPGGSGVAPQTFRARLGEVDVVFTLTADGAVFQVPAESPLSPGSYTLGTEVSDRAGHTASAQVTFTIEPPVVGPQGVLAGQVLTGDICNNQPLAGATVRLIHSGGEALTDAAGRFTMPAPIGLVWAEVAKTGFLSVQRSAQVVEGQTGALPTVFLASQDPKVTRVIASQGGIVTDSTGDAILDLPPGSLPQDTDVVMTIIQDKKASKGPPLRNFIPGVAVRLLPERLVLNALATLRVKNRLQMPVHPIFSFDWNHDTQVWERTAGAQITPDGQFFQSTIDHFSGAAPG